MAANANVLVNTEPTSTQDVMQRLQAIPGAVVHEVDLEADSQEDITAVLRHKICPIKGVTNTITCICF